MPRKTATAPMSHDSMENSNIFPLKFQSVSVGFPCGKSGCIRLGCAPGGFAGAILQAWRSAAALTPILAVCYTDAQTKLLLSGGLPSPVQAAFFCHLRPRGAPGAKNDSKRQKKIAWRDISSCYTGDI
ncbi:hypothetical protein [Subdoligranulum variabile]|uniref:hypothetical protein n=1 Tax=Subdoligranulum variabile TaxID=214851 RepID=UPI0026E922D1|nr:hypothetical protein [Subdoligranulum variabile]